MKQKLLLTYIVLMFLLIPYIAHAQEAYYFIQFAQQERGEMFLDEIDVIEGGQPIVDLGMYTHKIELFNFDDLVIKNFSIYIDQAGLFYDAFGQEPEMPEMPDYSIVTLTIPVIRNAERIVITDLLSDEQLTIDISQFATCNMDGICDISEDKRSCPEDCATQVRQEPPSPTEEEAEKTLEMVEEKEDGSLISYLIIFLIFILVLVIITIIIKKKRNLYK